MFDQNIVFVVPFLTEESFSIFIKGGNKMPKNKKDWVKLNLPRRLYPETFLKAFPKLALGAKILPWPPLEEFEFYALVYMDPKDRKILDKLKKLRN